ncbi:MAG TPA: TIGR01777 family oxidoreductase [Sunxiuqinia sp.]|nr:TIGR01777 family oxidoreductase [Sunxiuqinia sp.]
MKIAITGASGYLGSNIIQNLESNDHSVTPINRQLLYGDPMDLAKTISGCQAVINLAGAPILQRWTKKNKTIIYNSRIVTTKNLVKAINSLSGGEKPKVVVSASATGIYRANMVHDETSSKYANNFAARVVDDWEDSLVDLSSDVRVVVLRTGIVLGKKSQITQKLLPLFKLGLGGKIGNGKQPFPFIHIDDAVKAYQDAIEDENFNGIYNLVAPVQVNNAEFTRILGEKVNRPAFFIIPPFILKLLFGAAATMILENPEVLPQKLQKQNFRFNHPTLNDCLQEITTDV